MADLSDQNQKEWNNRAKQYDTEEWQKKLADQLIAFVREQVDNGFAGIPRLSNEVKEVSLLDYACGTGMVTRALRSHVTRVLGMDISEGMVEEFTSRMAQDGITNATAVRGNLIGCEDLPADVDAKIRGFDVAAVGLGFHHFHNSKLTLERLTERLKPGGVVLILDWIPSDRSDQAGHAHGHGHEHHQGHRSHGDHSHQSTEKEDDFKHMRHTIAHDGFDEPMMQQLFKDAGLIDPGFVTLDTPITLVMKGKEVKKTTFLARGRKPA